MRPAWESGAGFITLAVGGLLALNYPLLSLFDRDISVFGIPLPFMYLFVVWALLIVGLAALGERHGKSGNRKYGDENVVSEVGAPVSDQRHNTDD